MHSNKRKVKTKKDKKRLLLLVEPRSSNSAEVRKWLKDKGLLTAWALDVSHAIEELSDFTVEGRPDIVMLEASPIFECYQSLRAGLCGPEAGNDLSVVAMCESRSSKSAEPYYAANFAQLKTIIDRETGTQSFSATMNAG